MTRPQLFSTNCATAYKCFILLWGFIIFSVSEVSAIKPDVALDTIVKGTVVGITDGDTFTLLKKDSTTIKVRLASIDCPERKQAYSARAKEFVSDAIFGKEVEVRIQSKDRYRRYIAMVYYGRKCLNEELLKNGYAWHYKKYSKDARLQSMEDKARKLRRGLWADTHPVAPWNWRER
ncbi:thermonuclease family protein [Robiginitalea biformata]|mgnify:CR=1 FL=1|uniref:thermonuclease family protein n=1 Tax=Robiginitalea biformata TaxID=252307 RepID=UPI003B5CE8A2